MREGGRFDDAVGLVHPTLTFRFRQVRRIDDPTRPDTLVVLVETADPLDAARKLLTVATGDAADS